MGPHWYHLEVIAHRYRLAALESTGCHTTVPGLGRPRRCVVRCVLLRYARRRAELDGRTRGGDVH